MYAGHLNKTCLLLYVGQIMARQSRIDAPGALHHIVARGIERKKIFKDDTDQLRPRNRLTLISCYSPQSTVRYGGFAPCPHLCH